MLFPAMIAAAGFLSMGAVRDSGSPFEGTWSGTITVEGETNGTTTLEVSSSGVARGTYYNSALGVTGTVRGHIQKDGTFTLLGFRDDLVNGIDITCGQFVVEGDHMITARWGFAENGCDNPGWSQDLYRD